MHEFSTAVSIVEAVKKAAMSYGVAKVVGITLQIGKLSMLNHDQLLFGIEMASKDSTVEGATVTIEPLPTKIRCRKCGVESEITQEGALYEILTSLACSQCSSKDVEVIQGRECIIKDIQVEVEKT